MSNLMTRLTDALPGLDAFAGVLKRVGDPMLGPDGPAPIKDALYGVWLEHPLHPPVTDIPIGAWSLTALFDLGKKVSVQVGTKSVSFTKEKYPQVQLMEVEKNQEMFNLVDIGRDGRRRPLDGASGQEGESGRQEPRDRPHEHATHGSGSRCLRGRARPAAG